VYILRKRASRHDIAPIDTWIPHVLYSHLVLQDYLASRLPEKLVVSPMDSNRLLWQTNPIAFDQGGFVPSPGSMSPGDNAIKRWPYSSSYEMVPYSYAPDTTVTDGYYLTQGPTHRGYQSVGLAGRLGRRRLGDVAFPGQKVWLMDSLCRYSGKKQFYYAYPSARTLVAMFDASVSLRGTGSPVFVNTTYQGQPANPGWNPGVANGGTFALTHTYEPEAWEPAPLNNNGGGLNGFYRWTRRGLKGVDFGGAEVK
jgi:hypothetical protein